MLGKSNYLFNLSYINRWIPEIRDEKSEGLFSYTIRKCRIHEKKKILKKIVHRNCVGIKQGVGKII